MLKKILWKFGIYIESQKKYKKFLQEISNSKKLLDFSLDNLGVNTVNIKSQLNQDLIALIVNNFKQKGYFVEFGATNGFDLSNTYLLEKNFYWNGILAEPMPRWHKDLKKNRNCVIDKRCV